MSLIRCSECGKEISDQAKSCPYCGHPLKTADCIIHFNWGNPKGNSFLKTTVVIDNKTIGEMKSGHYMDCTVSEGAHEITLFFRGKPAVSETIIVNSHNPEEYFAYKQTMLGLKRVPANSVKWPKLGYNKKSSIPLAVRILVAVFAVVILVSLFFGVTDDDNSANPASVVSGTDPVAELTDDEKAAQLLDEASKKFADGKHTQAIKTCNDIVENYPNTEPALNMDTYLSEQYNAFPHFSATDIMKEYDDNVVNADKEYTGKVLVVSGTISSIDKTNGGRNLCVLLKSGTYFYGVQLNFNSDQEDAVAELSPGQDIEVIGKCTGKSGTILLIVDGENVMIEDCYIIS